MTISLALTSLPLGVSSAVEACQLFFAFAIGHALADFPLQGAFLSKHKNRHVEPPETAFGPLPASLWIYALSAHALVHAGFVWIITGSSALGFTEFLVHWIIDFAKSEKWTTFHSDQFLHVFSKLAYVILIWVGLFP